MMQQLMISSNYMFAAMSDSSLFEALTEDILMKMLFALIIAIIVVVVMIMASRSHMTVDGRTYSGNSARVLRRQDRFIRTTVTKRKIEKNDNKNN